MHDRCSRCLHIEDGACNCRDCDDICKKTPIGKHLKKDRTNGSTDSKTNSISHWTAPSSLKNLNDSELLDLVHMVCLEVSERGKQISFLDYLNTAAEQLLSTSRQIQELSAATPPFELFSEQGMIIEKAGFRPNGWWKESRENKCLNNERIGNQKKSSEEDNK